MEMTSVVPIHRTCAWYQYCYQHWYQGPYHAGMTWGNTRLTYQVYPCLIPGKNQPWTILVFIFVFQYPIPGPDRCWVHKLIPIQYWWWPPHNGHHLIHLHMHFEGQMKWSCQDHRTQHLQKNYFSGFYYEASEQICNGINEIVFHLLNFCCASIGLLSYPCTFVY